jgi:UDP-3-O-[3-hydroxymyristoyl] N-acetylglucosamine deacetylase/3-hydroxyacyl-[acyl-carrier-protein] dehydratase
MTPRRTIAGPATIAGIGLHTGSDVKLTFLPGESGSGIVFQRADLPSQPTIPARVDRVQKLERRTTLADGDATVETIEHVLAAVSAFAIDDILIQLTGPEPPAGDGSAAVFTDALQGAGVADNGGAPSIHSIANPFVVREGDATYIAAPHGSLRLTVTIEWDHPRIGRQSGCFEITPDAFANQLAQARTFGFADEAERLQQQGLARGASRANTIVLSQTDVIDTELRWPDEFVRHKTVDLLGDLALLGGPLHGDIVAFRPSHRGNVALVRAITRAGALTAPAIMGIEDILGVMPHRYPMLLVDRILEVEKGKRIVGIKNVTINEPFFQGHFPGHPIMPGVLIVEAMAQVGGMLLLGAVENPQNKVVYFMAIDGVKFRRPVTPGDQVRFELEMVQFRGKTCRMRGVGYVEGRPVAEAEMMAGIVDR